MARDGRLGQRDVRAEARASREVLTGCGHAGAVSIARHAMRLTGVDPFIPNAVGTAYTLSAAAG